MTGLAMYQFHENVIDKGQPFLCQLGCLFKLEM